MLTITIGGFAMDLWCVIHGGPMPRVFTVLRAAAVLYLALIAVRSAWRLRSSVRGHVVFAAATACAVGACAVASLPSPPASIWAGLVGMLAAVSAPSDSTNGASDASTSGVPHAEHRTVGDDLCAVGSGALLVVQLPIALAVGVIGGIIENLPVIAIVGGWAWVSRDDASRAAALQSIRTLPTLARSEDAELAARRLPVPSHRSPSSLPALGGPLVILGSSALAPRTQPQLSPDTLTRLSAGVLAMLQPQCVATPALRSGQTITWACTTTAAQRLFLERGKAHDLVNVPSPPDRAPRSPING